MNKLFEKIKKSRVPVAAAKPNMDDLLVRSIPEARLREEDLVLRMLLNGIWHYRRVILTKEKLSFTFAEEGEEQEIDYVPLHEIDFIKEMQDIPNVDRSDHEAGDMHAIQIATWQDGYNSGRTYYLRADSSDGCLRFHAKLRSYSKSARKRAEANNLFQRVQRKVRRVYDSDYFQFTMAALITTNFIFTIIETQEVDKLTNDDGSDTRLAITLQELNQAFTYLFTIELAINAFSHWFKPFVQDFWNVIDIVVIAISIFSIAITSQSTGIVRIMRALRVVRLFGRLKALKKIMTALSLAMLPVLNVFLILFLLLSIGAIVGVTLFRDLDPEDFAVFSVAFFTLFQVTSGDPWPVRLPSFHEDGNINWTVKIYTTVYMLIVVWVILQVSVAVLLDNFIGASTHIADEERLLHAEQKQRELRLKNPLEPLLMKLAREFTDNQDLTDRLRRLYAALDTDRSGGLDSRELCAAIKKLDFKPCIHISDSDFDSITQNGELCDERGHLGPKEFENVMRQQIRQLAQSRLALLTEVRSAEEADFMLHGTLKMILLEQTRMEKVLDQTARDVREIVVALGGAVREDTISAKEKIGNAPAASYRRRRSSLGLQNSSHTLNVQGTGAETPVKAETDSIKPALSASGSLNGENKSSHVIAARQNMVFQSSIKSICQEESGSAPLSLKFVAERMEKKIDELANAIVGPIRRDLSGLRALLTHPSAFAFVTATVAASKDAQPRPLIRKRDKVGAADKRTTKQLAEITSRQLKTFDSDSKGLTMVSDDTPSTVDATVRTASRKNSFATWLSPSEVHSPQQSLITPQQSLMLISTKPSADINPALHQSIQQHSSCADAQDDSSAEGRMRLASERAPASSITSDHSNDGYAQEKAILEGGRRAMTHAPTIGDDSIMPQHENFSPAASARSSQELGLQTESPVQWSEYPASSPSVESQVPPVQELESVPDAVKQEQIFHRNVRGNGVARIHYASLSSELPIHAEGTLGFVHNLNI